MIERRARVYPRILLVMFLLTIPLYALTFQGGLDAKGRPMGTDFIAFWSAARAATDGFDIDPWNLRELAAFQAAQFPGLAGPTAWVYPPFTLVLVWPLGYLPFEVAFLAWTAFGLAAFLTCLHVVIRHQRLAWPIAIAFPGLWLGIAHGQTQFVVSALMGGALITLARNPTFSGALIGLMMIKPHLAILFPLVLIAGGHWRTFASAAVTSIATIALSVVVLGPRSIRSWLEGMSLVGAAIDEGALPVYKFVTPYTSWQLLGVPGLPALLLHACVALPVAWIVWTIWRRTADIRIRGSVLIVGTFLVSPYAADYDLAVMAFPIAWLALLGGSAGWLYRDRNLLVATWILPWLTAPVALVTHVGVTPFIMGLLLWQLRLRVQPQHEHAQVDAAGLT